MMKMGKMGPEMERLKKKYGDDKDALNKAMMQFYKEQGIGPCLAACRCSCRCRSGSRSGAALQSTFELRHSPFLYFVGHHLTWISDLANPDALLSWPPFSFFGFDVAGLNLLPLLVGGRVLHAAEVHAQAGGGDAGAGAAAEDDDVDVHADVPDFPLQGPGRS